VTRANQTALNWAERAARIVVLPPIRRGRHGAGLAATVGLVLLASGCGNTVMGGPAPAPGTAATVEDSTLSLEQVDLLTDAVCESVEADPSSQATSRSIVQETVVLQWVNAEAARRVAEEEGVDVDSQSPKYDTIPGWADFSEEQQDAVRIYIDAVQYLQAALPEVGDEQGEVDVTGIDVTINPRFDVVAGDTVAFADRQTSVAVSDEAVAGTADELTEEQVLALPDGQLCGRRPEPAPQPLPGM
jgi:hypothetical protein